MYLYANFELKSINIDKSMRDFVFHFLLIPPLEGKIRPSKDCLINIPYFIILKSGLMSQD